MDPTFELAAYVISGEGRFGAEGATARGGELALQLLVHLVNARCGHRRGIDVIHAIGAGLSQGHLEEHPEELRES